MQLRSRKLGSYWATGTHSLPSYVRALSRDPQLTSHRAEAADT
jgi:hypothetical protein